MKDWARVLVALNVAAMIWLAAMKASGNQDEYIGWAYLISSLAVALTWAEQENR